MSGVRRGGARIDHLVVLAADLDSGSAWAREALGVEPGPGGEHVFMGTHNRLLRIAAPDHPLSYLEIIAPQSGRQPQEGRKRWFDMDDPDVMKSVRTQPRLSHFVACVPDLDAALARLAALDIALGEPVAASRMTASGLLQWRISLRRDGRRLFDGCMPTLIEWGEVHPEAAMPPSGVALQSLDVAHPEARLLREAYAAVGLSAVRVREADAELVALLHTPLGRVQLTSRAS